MSFEKVPLKNYYFLRERESVSLDPWRDSKVYFGENSLYARIAERMETDFQKPRGVPKFFIFGGYGQGKTHTLAHIAYKLTDGSIHPAEPIYVDIAPMSAKERYQRLHTRLIDAIGMERVRHASEIITDRSKSTDKVKVFLDENVLLFGDETLRVSQANVFRNFLFGGRQSQLSWEWMKGRKNKTDEAQMLGVQKDLAEATDLLACLLNIGSVIYAATGKKIVFLMDEVEAIRSVTNPDCLTELHHIFRLLVEDSNRFIGLVLAIQSEGGMETIGEFFTSEDIMRRVDFEQGYVDLGTVVNQPQSARQFILSVLNYLVDQAKADEVIKAENLGTQKELFPFTEDAIGALCSHVADEPRRASPAFILSTMSSAAIGAWRTRAQSKGHVLVDAPVIEQTVFPEG